MPVIYFYGKAVVSISIYFVNIVQTKGCCVPVAPHYQFSKYSNARQARDYTIELCYGGRVTSVASGGEEARRTVLYIFLPFRPCLTRKKSTFINLLRDICAHNFRDPAIKLQAQTLEAVHGVGYTISSRHYLLFDFAP